MMSEVWLLNCPNSVELNLFLEKCKNDKALAITKTVNLMHSKCVKYSCIYALKTGKICHVNSKYTKIFIIIFSNDFSHVGYEWKLFFCINFNHFKVQCTLFNYVCTHRRNLKEWQRGETALLLKVLYLIPYISIKPNRFLFLPQLELPSQECWTR